MINRVAVVCVVVGCALSARLARAEVTRVDIAKRADIGMSGYEKMAGTVHFAVDPKDPHNRIVVDLDKAPRNNDGRVEFSADMYVLRPKDPARGNGSALVEVSNRGGRGAIQLFNRGGPNPDPDTEGDLGDKFLMRFGFTVAWIGWELDVARDPGMRLHPPVATDHRAADPPVAGLGFLAMRDFGSWLKNRPAAESPVRYTYAFGSSQGGRFLRGFLYEGFNTDEHDRQVFDGVMAHIAGAARIDLNARRSTPVGLSVHSASAFPFADAALRDPVSGAQEGLLDNSRARGHQPKVFYTNTPVEYWGTGRVAALVHTTADGTADLTPPDNVRVYFFAGTQHAPARFPPAVGAGQQIDNPVEYAWTLRALLLAMHRWVSTDAPPPASAYPTLADRTLVMAGAVAFPAIPTVASPAGLTAGARVANPLLPGGAGAGAPLPLLVPAVDEDGNERGGIRLPDVAVPLATYTGWNFRDRSTGSPGELVSLLGSSVPFPATRAAREAAKDPRRSIEERYPSRDEYLAQVEKVADALVLRGYLLIDDVPRIVQRATDTWDSLVASR
jgi:hypothetical protein